MESLGCPMGRGTLDFNLGHSVDFVKSQSDISEPLDKERGICFFHYLHRAENGFVHLGVKVRNGPVPREGALNIPKCFNNTIQVVH